MIRMEAWWQKPFWIVVLIVIVLLMACCWIVGGIARAGLDAYDAVMARRIRRRTDSITAPGTVTR